DPETPAFVGYRRLVNDDRSVHFDGYDIAVFHLLIPYFQGDFLSRDLPLANADITSAGSHMSLAVRWCRYCSRGCSLPISYRFLCCIRLQYFIMSRRFYCFSGRCIRKGGDHHSRKGVRSVAEVERIKLWFAAHGANNEISGVRGERPIVIGKKC